MITIANVSHNNQNNCIIYIIVCHQVPCSVILSEDTSSNSFGKTCKYAEQSFIIISLYIDVNLQKVLLNCGERGRGWEQDYSTHFTSMY